MPIDLKMVEEAAEFYAQNERMPPWYDVPVDAVSRLLHAAPEMYALLRELEWREFDRGALQCPYCTNYKPGETGGSYTEGHAPDCRLAAVLKAVEGTT